MFAIRAAAYSLMHSRFDFHPYSNFHACTCDCLLCQGGECRLKSRRHRSKNGRQLLSTGSRLFVNARHRRNKATTVHSMPPLKLTRNVMRIAQSSQIMISMEPGTQSPCGKNEWQIWPSKSWSDRRTTDTRSQSGWVGSMAVYFFFKVL